MHKEGDPIPEEDAETRLRGDEEGGEGVSVGQGGGASAPPDLLSKVDSSVEYNQLLNRWNHSFWEEVLPSSPTGLCPHLQGLLCLPP